MARRLLHLSGLAMIAALKFRRLSPDRLLYPVVPLASLAALAASVIYTAGRSLEWPLVEEPLWLQYIARQFLEGEVPYRDVFTINMPGTILAHAAVAAAAGSGDRGFYVLNLIMLAVTAGVVAKFCQGLNRWALCFAPLALAAYYLTQMPRSMGSPDLLVSPLLVVAGHGVATSLEHEPGSRLRLLWVGLAVGAAAIIKPTAILWLGMLVTLFSLYRWRSLRTARTGSAAMLLGAALPMLATLSWLGMAGGLAAFWQILSGFVVPSYRELYHVRRQLLITQLGVDLVLWAPAIPLLALMPRPLLRAPSPRHAVIAAGLVYGLAHRLIQSTGEAYEFLPLRIFLVIAVSAVLGTLLSRRGGRRRLAGIVSLALVAVALTFQCFNNGRVAYAAQPAYPLATQLSADLDGFRLQRGESIQVLDSYQGSARVLLSLGLRQATRFYADYPLRLNPQSPTTQGLRSEFVAKIEANPPRVVVVFHDYWAAGHGDGLASFPELARFLAAQYEFEKSVQHGYTIYVRR